MSCMGTWYGILALDIKNLIRIFHYPEMKNSITRRYQSEANRQMKNLELQIKFLLQRDRIATMLDIIRFQMRLFVA